MISEDEQKLNFVIMDLKSRIDMRDKPNLAYVDLKISNLVFDDELVDKINQRFTIMGISVKKIFAKRAAQAWLRFRKI